MVSHLPIIPDLRFEQSYLRSISPYLDVQPHRSKAILDSRGATGESTPIDGSSDWQKSFDDIASPDDKAIQAEKGKDAARLAFGQPGFKHGLEDEPSVSRMDPIPIHAVRVNWQGVAWVTVRDQLVSPLVQGALWGVASHFFRPALSIIGAHIRLLFASHQPSRPVHEGSGVEWLRSWARTWTSGQSTHQVAAT